ncbi:polysaccharide biosynthesis protein [Candidatus Sumerlaeota bacterium]
MLTDYEFLATGRRESLFTHDLDQNRPALDDAIRGARIAVIGAAGSIGFAVIKNLLPFRPAALALIDLNENNLVEIVRELRATPDLPLPQDFAALPIGIGSIEGTRFFRESKPFDYILNLSAVKHVRSEKNIYSLIRMIDTNVLFLHDLLAALPYRPRKFFSVSSDKAVNPASLLGAGKRLMEIVMAASEHSCSSARFANVAFSDGSLPHGLLKRIQKHQPIAAPSNIRRYFISHEEAGQICLLASILGQHGDSYFPKPSDTLSERSFPEIATDLLAQLGYQVHECASPDDARRQAAELIARKRWPCCFQPAETSGEKPFEEFHTTDETIDFEQYERLGVIKLDSADLPREQLSHFLDFARQARHDPNAAKQDYVRELAPLIPGFQHRETGKDLDQQM